MGNRHSRARQSRKTKKKLAASKENLADTNGVSTNQKPVNAAVQKQEKPKVQLRALFDYESMDMSTNQGLKDISFEKGDILLAAEDEMTTDWFVAENSRTKQVGLIPFNYVVQQDGSPSSLESWFKVTRVEAERLLQVMSNIVGTYLLRPSTDKAAVALSVRYCDSQGVWSIKHYKIKTLDSGGYYLHSNLLFNNMSDLIQYYKETTGGLCVKLTVPCPRNQSPPLQFRDMEVNRKNFLLTSLLGKGNFGEVWKAKWGRTGNLVVAVKKVQPNTMSNDEFIEEAKIMHGLNHPRIVTLLGVATLPADEPIFIITEYMSNGSLLDFLRSPQGRRVEFIKLIDMIAQIAEGMTYLERMNYIHRDLRAANILVDENYFVKVSDFGLTRVVQSSEDAYTSNETKFPVRWTAPEAALYGTFSTKSDVWSFGVLIFEIVTFGATPYSGKSNKEVITEVSRNHYRLENPHGLMATDDVIINCPSDLYDQMNQCWRSNPNDRPTFEALGETFENWAIATEIQYQDQ